MPQTPDRDAFFVHRADTSLRRLGKQDIQRALIFDHTHRPDPAGGTEGGGQTSEPPMRAARVECTPLVAELLKSFGAQSALRILSLSETGGKAAAGANLLPVAHIVAAKARQELKQVVGERAQRTFDEGFALRLKGRSGFLLNPEVRESGACVVGGELLAVVASHDVGHSPREDRAAQCGADGGRG